MKGLSDPKSLFPFGQSDLRRPRLSNKNFTKTAKARMPKVIKSQAKMLPISALLPQRMKKYV